MAYDKSVNMALPSDLCPKCGKRYKNYRTLKSHITTKHPDYNVNIDEVALPPESDLVNNHTLQLLRVLLIKRSLDFAIQSGNGETLSLIMKHMILYYRQLGYTNYALACLEHVAQCNIFLSPRLSTLIKHECFVNNAGKKNRNMAMDMDVEHQVRFFKENFRLCNQEPSEAVLQRLSLAQDMVEKMLCNFHSEFQIETHCAKRVCDENSYKRDVLKMSKYLEGRHVFINSPGRLLKSDKLKDASFDPLLLIDMFDLKQWLQMSIQRMSCQRFLK